MNHSSQKLFFHGPDGTSVSDDCARWRDLVTQPWFRRGITHALATFVEELPKAPLQAIACDQRNQVEGAKEFIKVLLNLGEVYEPKRRREPTLDHSALPN